MATEAFGIIASIAGLGKALLDISAAINTFVGISEEARSIWEHVEALRKVSESL
jgi:hypothetical protein